MPGYIGGAYDFCVDGNFDKATIKFEFNEGLLEDDDFEPVIYYFNEEKQLLEELETTVIGNVASTEVTHFSKYILINRKVYESSFEWQDVWSATGYNGVEIVLVIDDSGSLGGDYDYDVTTGMFTGGEDPEHKRLEVARNFVDNANASAKIGIVKFDGVIDNISNGLIECNQAGKDTLKDYLQFTYISSGSYNMNGIFDSRGHTYMYGGIETAMNQFSKDSDDILKVLVVFTDGQAHDVNKHSSVISTDNNNGVKIYTVGLGNSSTYFTKYLEPLAKNTGGAFYLASNANELTDIYKDINEKIDIETDSDGDGITDYYEDNMVVFNGVKLELDKNNPDTDNDGILDGEEVCELKYEYNADKTKVIVTGRMISNPLDKDTDGDLDIDSIDPEPLDYQLNDLMCYNISQLNNLAIDYKNKNNYGSSEFNTNVETWLTFMFIRQFNSSYVGGNWNGTGKSIDDGFVEYVKQENVELYTYFENKSDFYATSSGETGDLYHSAATATGYIYNSDYEDGFKFGFMPEYHLNNLSGWAGDLQTAMNDAMIITNSSNDYDVFKQAMKNLIGYDASVSDVYSGYSHTFDIDDVYADTDAYNLYKLLKSGKTVEEALDNYYKTCYLKRYSEFTNYWSESRIKDTTYIYTKNKYMGVVQWPLFKYDFKTKQSKAARDAFAEFLLERIKYE